MSASPEPQVASRTASPEHDVPTEAAIQDPAQESHAEDNNNDDEISDDESFLSEVDEAQFDNFDPENVDLEDRPLPIDEDNLKLIGRHKRKRADGDEGTSRRKKEGRRPKKSQADSYPEETEKTRRSDNKRRQNIGDIMDDQEIKDKRGSKGRSKKKADSLDLEAMLDKEIEDMRKRMALAAEMDANSRQQGEPAVQKLKLLPEVLRLLSRTQCIDSLVDPEINLLQGVRFFLEPSDDGSLPAFNIQRDLLTAISKLPIHKDALIASGIGKVVLFYTKSKRTEKSIKVMSDRLLAEWTRPILHLNDDYRNLNVQKVNYDPTKNVKSFQSTSQIIAAHVREADNLPPRLANRARVDRTNYNVEYTVAPQQLHLPSKNPSARPMGSAGEDRFRKMKRQQAVGLSINKRKLR
ncbi:Transcription factor IIS N-terminal [Penicillium taxi]|uniref:Transcription factor IIS N-terminal n=1 Tax=Penicillium taxi TaxID=168475 RepID=UPI002545919F|nr:Transcription factor IIS N-terminal [Penicillium taxi]KAJ5902100.1 Transcription factor IIS N-terminal [Penicillium taxi]